MGGVGPLGPALLPAFGVTLVAIRGELQLATSQNAATAFKTIGELHVEALQLCNLRFASTRTA